MKNYLLAAIGISVLALSGFTCAFLFTLRTTVAVVPHEIAQTRVELVHQVDALRLDSLAEIDKQATGIRKDANIQLAVIRKDAVAQIVQIAGIADRQLSGTRSDLKQTVAESVKTLIGPVEGLRSDLQPVIANTASLTKQVDEQAPLFLDCESNPDCVFNRFQGTSKAIEKTMEAVAVAAPQLGESAVANGKNFAGITEDAHKFTTQFTAKRSLKQKIWNGFKAVAELASRF